MHDRLNLSVVSQLLNKAYMCFVYHYIRSWCGVTLQSELYICDTIQDRAQIVWLKIWTEVMLLGKEYSIIIGNRYKHHNSLTLKEFSFGISKMVVIMVIFGALFTHCDMVDLVISSTYSLYSKGMSVS